MAVYLDLRGTSNQSFRIGINKFDLDASGATALRTITLGDADITFAAPSNGDVLAFNGTNWEPTAGGGGGGSDWWSVVAPNGSQLTVRNAANTLDLSILELDINDSLRIGQDAASILVYQDLTPSTDKTFDLGMPAQMWQTGYFERFYNSGDVVTIHIENSMLCDGSGNDSIAFASRLLYDSTGNDSLDYEQRRLLDSSSVMSIDYEARQLLDAAASLVFDYSNSTSAVLSRHLVPDGNLTRNIGSSSNMWQTGYFERFYDSGDVSSIHLTNRTLHNGSGAVSLHFGNYFLVDSVNTDALEWSSSDRIDILATTSNTPRAVALHDGSSGQYVALRAPSSLALNINFTLPDNEGTAGYVLETDGAGNTDWVPAGGGGAVNIYRGASVAGPLIVQTNAGLPIFFPENATIQKISAYVRTAPTGADIIIDVNLNGTTIFTTQANRPTIPDGTNVDASAIPDVTSITAGDVLEIDVDQIGSGTAGEDLVVVIQIQE